MTLGLNVSAKDKKAATAAPAPAAVETYKVDAAASTLNWKGTKKLGTFHEGTMAIQGGSVMVEKDMVKSGDVTVDMTTLKDLDQKDADNNKKLVGHLSSPDFFNVAKYPTSTFKITSVTPAKMKNLYTVKGDFTMVGQTHPIEFPATITIANGQANGEATVEIDRTVWGLKYNSGNYLKDLAADKVINDKFELKLKLVAKK
ncbi:YceI family protein [Bdellovibrio sp. qaytius]|nr:YceI family protein [Bdellovibrio sp. qaytius]